MSAWYLALILAGLVIAWLAGAAHGYRTREATERARPKKRRAADCVDCGAQIIAADDDALVCVQCGGRNRRVGHRVGSNPPPPVGAKPLPPHGPQLRTDRMDSDARYVPWIDPEKERIADELAVAHGLKPDPHSVAADEVRKIVREEIERAIRPASKSGRMGPG